RRGPGAADRPRPERDRERRGRSRAAPPAPPIVDAPGRAGSPRRRAGRYRQPLSARLDELAEVLLRAATEVVRPLAHADVARPARSFDSPRPLFDQPRDRGGKRLAVARQLARARFDHFRQVDSPSCHLSLVLLRYELAHHTFGAE